MIRNLFRWVMQLAFLLVVVLFLTAVWIVCEGLSDTSQHATIALVPGETDPDVTTADSLITARLDKAAELVKSKQISSIVICGDRKLAGFDEAASMTRYLETQEVSDDAIIAGTSTADAHEIALRCAAILKDQDNNSIVLVTQYYQVTRLKLALQQAGIKNVEHLHVGQLHKSDALDIGREVIAFYRYLFTFYFLPEAKELSAKAKVEGTQARDAVNRKLDSLSK